MRFQFIADDLKLLADESCDGLDKVAKLAAEHFERLSGENRYVSILNLENMVAYKFDREGFKRL